MAIYHLQSKIISRGQKRSVVAAAAYRAAAALHDAELDRTHNFLAKPGVIHSEILLPDHAPRRWLDREVLWNEVAVGERLSNGAKRQSQLAREIEIALPRELGRAEAVRLAQDFVREQFVSRGMVADLNVHWGRAGDGEAQPHAHVMLSMRRIETGRRARQETSHGREAHRGRDPERSQGRARDVAGDPGADAGAVGRPDPGDAGGAAGDPGGAAKDPGHAAGDADAAGHHRASARLHRLIAAARLRAGLCRHAAAQEAGAGTGLDPEPEPAGAEPAGHPGVSRFARLVAAARLRPGLRRHAVASEEAWLGMDDPTPVAAADGSEQPARSLDPAARRQVASRLAHRVAAVRLRTGLRRHGVALSKEASPEAAASGAVLASSSEGSGFGLKERAWNDRALLRVWRERWAEMANARLAKLGHDQRIDHRSHAARGLGLEPQNKIGPAGARRAQRGEDAERADEHRAIAWRNGERLLARPELALEALTQQQSTFTRADLARLVHRQTDGAEQFAAVMAQAEASPELVWVGEDGRGRSRFSTREMVGVEQRLLATAVALNRRTTHRVGDKRRIAPVYGQGLGEEQHLAYLHVTRSRDLAVVTGIAGGGKSTMLEAARQAWEGQGYRVRGAALSGIAAEGLEGSAGIESRTIAGWEHAWGQGKERLGARDVLVVDEAGMVGSRQLGGLVQAAHAAGAKLVLVGDAEQLQAIEAGAAFRAIADRVGVIAITEPRRQVLEWQRMATKELATARTGVALDRYQGAGMVHRHAAREAAHAGVIASWEAARRAAPGSSQIIFAHERADVRALNDAARAVRRAAGELGPDRLLPTEAGMRAFAEGDRVYFLRNERGLGVRNGTLGTLERIEGERLGVRLDGADGAGTGRAVTFGLAEYADLDHGYAATVHKNQGATVDQAHVLATPGMDRHLAYVALSRHRHAVQLHWGENDFGNAARLRTVLGRERAKDTTLDYGAAEADPVAAYAGRRGLDPLRPESAIVVRPEPAPVPGHSGDNAGPGVPEGIPVAPQPPAGPGAAAPETPAPAPPAAAPESPLAATVNEDGLPEPDGDPAGPIRVLTEAERLELRRILSGEDGVAPPPAPPEAAPAVHGAETDRLPERGPERLEPMLPGVPYRPVTAEEIAAVVDADKAVQIARRDVADYLELAYRDPAEAARRLAALEKGPGGTAAVAPTLARQPEALGQLRGSGWLITTVEAAAERDRARKAVGRIDYLLVKRRDAEWLAAGLHRNPVEAQRRLAVVEVPGLSRQALRAVQAVSSAGATVGWTDPMPWDTDPPTPDGIARAARVAPVWAAIMAKPGLHGELQRFMEAARQRLPDHHWEPRDDLDGPEQAVQALSGVLHGARALYLWHPRFQAYAADEPRRQAEAAREQAERDAAAAKEAEQARRIAEEKARAKAEIDARIAAALARPGPSSGPGVR
jgi:Ti-type conjugative transfer relaxase TraA